MEDLKELIALAVEEGVKRGLANVNLTNSKDPYELLTAEQVAKETGIAVNKVRQLFNDPDMGVQSYTKPKLVTRKALNEFMSVRRWKQMKRKLDKNKVGFAIAFITTTALLINKVVQAGTIFCLTTIYR